MLLDIILLLLVTAVCLLRSSRVVRPILSYGSMIVDTTTSSATCDWILNFDIPASRGEQAERKLCF